MDLNPSKRRKPDYLKIIGAAIETDKSVGSGLPESALEYEFVHGGIAFSEAYGFACSVCSLLRVSVTLR